MDDPALAARGVAAALVVLALLGATGAWVLGRTASISNDLVDVKSPALTTSYRLESALLNQETGIRGYGLTGTPEFLDPYRQGLTEEQTHTARLAALLQGDRAALADLNEVQDAIEGWQLTIARPVATSPAAPPRPWPPPTPPKAKRPSTHCGQP